MAWRPRETETSYEKYLKTTRRGYVRQEDTVDVLSAREPQQREEANHTLLWAVALLGLFS